MNKTRIPYQGPFRVSEMIGLQSARLVDVFTGRPYPVPVNLDLLKTAKDRRALIHKYFHSPPLQTTTSTTSESTTNTPTADTTPQTSSSTLNVHASPFVPLHPPVTLPDGQQSTTTSHSNPQLSRPDVSAPHIWRISHPRVQFSRTTLNPILTRRNPNRHSCRSRSNSNNPIF